MIPRPSSPTLRRVLAGDLCSGCGLCAGVSGGAVRIEEASPGYNRPHQYAPVSPEAERRIAHCCPGAAVKGWPEAPETDPYWGPCLTVSTGHSTDPRLRFSASSGGMLSALLIHALESGLVDEVVQIATDPADPTRNVVRRSATAAEVTASAGSRYAPSSPLDHVADLLAEERRFAFVGKPCDVSALRRLGELDERVSRRFPVVISFFCGGIPSTAGTQQILDDLGVDRGDLAGFKYRGDGWPGAATATRHDGSVERMSYPDSWGGRLSFRLQFRCKICPDAVGGAADIACADAWFGDEKGYPLFEETEGRSLVIARNEAGRALVDAAVRAGRIELQPSSLAEVALMQPYQAQRKRLIVARLAGIAATLQPYPDYRGVKVLAAARRVGPVEAVRNFLGTIRRIVTRQR
jgi:coenzyme F420 hydrogenase subunit beta